MLAWLDHFSVNSQYSIIILKADKYSGGSGIFHYFHISVDLSNFYSEHCFPFPKCIRMLHCLYWFPLSTYPQEIFEKNRTVCNGLKSVFLKPPIFMSQVNRKGKLPWIFQDILSFPSFLFLHVVITSVLLARPQHRSHLSLPCNESRCFLLLLDSTI